MVAKDFNLDGKIALVAGDSKYWSKYAGAALAEVMEEPKAKVLSDSAKLPMSNI